MAYGSSRRRWLMKVVSGLPGTHRGPARPARREEVARPATARPHAAAPAAAASVTTFTYDGGGRLAAWPPLPPGAATAYYSYLGGCGGCGGPAGTAPVATYVYDAGAGGLRAAGGGPGGVP